MTIELKLVRKWINEAKIGCERLGYEEGTQSYKDHIRKSVYLRRHSHITNQRVQKEFEEYEKRVTGNAGWTH